MGKLAALGAVRKAWNVLRDVINVKKKTISKRRGAVGKVIMNRKKRFGKGIRLMLGHSRPDFKSDARRSYGRKAAAPVRFATKLSRMRCLTPTTVVNRILPRADHRQLAYVSHFLEDGVVWKPESEAPRQAESTCAEAALPEACSSQECPPGEVDIKAEAFISKFYEQMKLQRQRSIGEYQDMLARGVR